MPILVLILMALTGCAHEHFFETDAGASADVSVVPMMDAEKVMQEVGVDGDAELSVQDVGVISSDADVRMDAGDSSNQDVSTVDMGEPLDMGASADAEPTVDMGAMPPMDAALPVDQGMEEPPTVGYSLCGIGMTERVGVGTWAEPIEIGRFPFVDRASTSEMGESVASRYDCAEDTGEAGPELVYRFTLDGPGDFVAQVLDAQGVDIDLHLLRAPSIEDGLASGCVGRAHRKLEVTDLEPGEYLLVADSWSSQDGEVFDGQFEIAADVSQSRVWREVPLAEGIVWARYQGPVDGAWQSVNVLRIAPSAMTRMIIDHHNQCETVETIARAREYLAGVNGGFFTPGCYAKGFLRVDDRTLSYSAATTSEPPLENEARVGWRDDNIWFFWREAGAEWTLPRYALGLHPMLVQDGEPRAEVQEGVEVFSSIDWTPQPRTVIGHDESGDVLLVTLDGRTNAGAGMTTPALAVWLDETFSLRSAINLDGGGSTTFVVNGCWIGPNMGDSGLRVFNAPSDNGEADELGARPVGNGIYLQ